jgi:hypothetical protein
MQPMSIQENVTALFVIAMHHWFLGDDNQAEDMIQFASLVYQSYNVIHA